MNKFTTQELVEHHAKGRSAEYERGIRTKNSKDLTEITVLIIKNKGWFLNFE